MSDKKIAAANIALYRPVNCGLRGRKKETFLASGCLLQKSKRCLFSWFCVAVGRTETGFIGCYIYRALAEFIAMTALMYRLLFLGIEFNLCYGELIQKQRLLFKYLLLMYFY